MKWLLFPFTALWKLMTIILELTGRMLAIIMGTLFIALGIALILTVVASPLGIALLILGILLLIRSLF